LLGGVPGVASDDTGTQTVLAWAEGPGRDLASPHSFAAIGPLKVEKVQLVVARSKSPSKVDLQAVLRFVEARNWVESAEFIAWIVETFGCRTRAAKDNVSVLVQGGWLARERDERDRRRLRYAITEKGREDMFGSFGRAALDRGRRCYSTCLSGASRRRQAARRARAENPLAQALELEARRLFAGIDTARLTRQFIAGGGFGTLRRRHKGSPFRARLRDELLGQGRSS